MSSDIGSSASLGQSADNAPVTSTSNAPAQQQGSKSRTITRLSQAGPSQAKVPLRQSILFTTKPGGYVQQAIMPTLPIPSLAEPMPTSPPKPARSEPPKAWFKNSRSTVPSSLPEKPRVCASSDVTTHALVDQKASNDAKAAATMGPPKSKSGGWTWEDILAEADKSNHEGQ